MYRGGRPNPLPGIKRAAPRGPRAWARSRWCSVFDEVAAGGLRIIGMYSGRTPGMCADGGASVSV